MTSTDPSDDFPTLLDFDVARSIILRASSPISDERISLSDGSGRVLAAPVIAQTSQPPFHASAMDGYAVRSAETDVNRDYPVAFEVGAGSAGAQELPPGAVARIFTGAPLPQGADAVIIQENAQRVGGLVRFGSAALAGQNVRPEGKDFAAGDRLLPEGIRLSAAALGLAAASNNAELSVVCRPRVSLLSTGDELAEPGATLMPGQIVGSNVYMLRALLQPHADVTNAGTVHDDPHALKMALSRALADQPDVLITTGGASVGDRDHMLSTLKELGATIHFWKIAMRPGKPVIFATLGTTLIFGLPGNPVSAFVTSSLLVLPSLQRLSGAAPTAWMDARLETDLPPNPGRRHFMRGHLTFRNAELFVLPETETDSAHLSSLSAANALIDLPTSNEPMPAGHLIRVLPLNGGF